MAKAVTETTEAVKRAPRKRAVRRVVTKDGAAPVRRARVTAPKIDEPEASTARKAPTRVVTPEPKTTSRKFMMALVGFVVVVGAASWIGFSDDGVIDVTERINTSNQDAADASSAETGDNGGVTVPVQNTPPAAISGIRPRTDGGQTDTLPAPPEEPPTLSTEATTTDVTTEESSTDPTEPEEAGAVEPEEAFIDEGVVPQIAP